MSYSTSATMGNWEKSEIISYYICSRAVISLCKVTINVISHILLVNCFLMLVHLVTGISELGM